MNQKYLFFILLMVSLTYCTFLRENQEIIHDSDSSFLPISDLFFNFGGTITPKPSKKETGGEDALLASKYLLGIADGVGSWIFQGIDPRDYSYRLLHNSDVYFRAYPQAYANNPKKLLVLSNMTNFYQGSSTAVLCSLSGNKLFSVNMGDSGYMILSPDLKNKPRNRGTGLVYEISFKSSPQQHRFNFPFQLGPNSDDPQELAETASHNVKEGDIVLVYSDGVGDNLFDEEFLIIVNLYILDLMRDYGRTLDDFILFFDPFELSDRIQKKAFEKSLNKSNVTPFRIEALNWGFITTGGKSDDIAISVGMVMKKEEEIDQNEDLLDNLEQNEQQDDSEE